jgi:lipopolysaccharide transport system permease protein
MIRQLRLLWQKRELTRYLVLSEIKTQYRNSALGYLWTMLDPLMMMGVYILLVVGVFGRGGPQYPVILFSALLAWWWFTSAVNSSVTAISAKATLIQSIYFPKGALPLKEALSGLVRYVLSLVVLVPFLIAYEAHWTVNMLWMPVLVLIQLLFTIGFCFFVSALGVYFRDIQNILQFVTRAWFFLSPALYTVADRVPERYQTIYMLNPFAALFESYRNVLVYGNPPNTYMGVAAAVSVLVFLGGLEFFARKEQDFAKAV